ncbi:MAG: PAS domain-containing sensor histidine kinase [Chitinophagales bacterium]|nr:PAS domain-containing sensor histidine kinase [Chitinophagales bacterium]
MTVLIVAGLGYLLSGVTDYRVTALLLLVSVSLLAMVMRIGPVLVASLLSALVWDFFFIPPKFTFHVGTAEDALLLLMYFVISLLNGVLTLRIRQIDNQHREKQEKENTIKLYNTLLNSLSHELRTPIATIIAATDYLQSKNNSGPDVNSKDLLNEISTASLRLNQQVENLLNMSRLESGFIRAKKDWCDMRELIHATLNKVKQPGVTYNIKVDIADDLPLFKLDYGLTEQVLHNLIVNALAYTPKGTLITIAAYCEYNSCMLSVTDRGNGFPETELENVFDKFYRLDNKSTGGTGLGLSIVKGFTEAQGGTVLLQNMQEGGARFLIELPAETSYINALKNE